MRLTSGTEAPRRATAMEVHLSLHLGRRPRVMEAVVHAVEVGVEGELAQRALCGYPAGLLSVHRHLSRPRMPDWTWRSAGACGHCRAVTRRREGAGDHQEPLATLGAPA